MRPLLATAQFFTVHPNLQGDGTWATAVADLSLLHFRFYHFGCSGHPMPARTAATA